MCLFELYAHMYTIYYINERVSSESVKSGTGSDHLISGWTCFPCRSGELRESVLHFSSVAETSVSVELFNFYNVFSRKVFSSKQMSVSFGVLSPPPPICGAISLSPAYVRFPLNLSTYYLRRRREAKEKKNKRKNNLRVRILIRAYYLINF